MRTATVAATLLLLIACSSPASIDRSKWQQMPRSERVLYVKSLLGAERAKAAKGGEARVYSQSPDAYVEMIDAAYRRGERRNLDELFESLADRVSRPGATVPGGPGR